MLAYMAEPSQIFFIGARFNAWIALFNLIPFMGLDGSKIFSWNKMVWIATMAASVSLYITSSLITGRSLLGFF